MALNIAPTSFNGNPDDSVVTVDVYGTPPQSPTNNLLSQMKIAQGSDSKALFGAKVGSAFGRLVGDVLDGVSKGYLKTGKLDLDTSLDRVSKATGIDLGELKGMNGSNALTKVLSQMGYQTDQITKELGNAGLPGVTGVGGIRLGKLVLGNADDVRVLVDDVRTTIKGFDDIRSISALSDMIDKITGETGLLKFANLTDGVAAIRGINYLVQDLGLVSLMDKMLDKMSDEDREYTILETIDDSPSLSDLQFVNRAIDELGAAALLTKNPNLIHDILSSYQGDLTYPDPTNNASWVYIDTTLKRLNANWAYVPGVTGVCNLELFRDITEYVKKAMLNAEQYVAALTIANSYSSKPFASLAFRDYPWLSFQ